MIAAVLIVAALAGGYVIGRNAGYVSGKDAATAELLQRYEEASATPVPVGAPRQEVLAISGTVTAIGSDSLTIEAPQVVSNPFVAPAPTTRTVRISGETQLVRLEAKTPEQYNAELEAFNRELDAIRAARLAGGGTDAPDPIRPRPDSEGPITLAEITAGMAIEVSSDTDIATADVIDATSVRVIIPREAPPVDPASVDAQTPEGTEIPTEPTPAQNIDPATGDPIN